MLNRYFPCLPNKNKSPSAVGTLATLVGIHFSAVIIVQLNDNEFSISVVWGEIKVFTMTNTCHLQMERGIDGERIHNIRTLNSPPHPIPKENDFCIHSFINSLVPSFNKYFSGPYCSRNQVNMIDKSMTSWSL